ncbi:MAG: TIM barrel protein [Zestosphaera sp.]
MVCLGLGGLFVGPAGIPLSAKGSGVVRGVRVVRELGLSAMEIEFVRGVWLKSEDAPSLKEVASEVGVVLSVHAPYYINLLSKEEKTVRESVERILNSARVGYLAGAWSLVFHPGYYGKLSSETAVSVVRNILKNVVSELIDEGVKIWVRPETMGGLAEFGSLEEVIAVVEGVEMAHIALDFAHLYARSRGTINKLREFEEILELVEARLGKEALKNMHIHLSGIEYGDRGEKRHLDFKDSRFNWVDAVKALKNYNVEGVIICESPSLESDALLIKQKIEELNTLHT